MARVLLVDDDGIARQIFRAALRLEGYSVMLAQSGQDAIEQISTGPPPDAVLLDLKLGDMTGYDVLRWMRTHDTIVPTVVTTAFPLEFDPDEAIELGAIAYADHALSLEEIVAVVNSMSTQPSPCDDPQRLHIRVLVGDPVALDCLDALFLKVVPPRLEKIFPSAPWDFAVDAAVDASLEYSAAPNRFDPRRLSSVVDFVCMIARRNLANRFDSEVKRKQREWRYVHEQELTSSSQLESPQSRMDVCKALMEVAESEAEREAARRWLAADDNELIADALGYGNVDSEGRRQEARRFKDRLRKRLSRKFR